MSWWPWNRSPRPPHPRCCGSWTDSTTIPPQRPRFPRSFPGWCWPWSPGARRGWGRRRRRGWPGDGIDVGEVTGDGQPFEGCGAAVVAGWQDIKGARCGRSFLFLDLGVFLELGAVPARGQEDLLAGHRSGLDPKDPASPGERRVERHIKVQALQAGRGPVGEDGGHPNPTGCPA